MKQSPKNYFLFFKLLKFNLVYLFCIDFLAIKCTNTYTQKAYIHMYLKFTRIVGDVKTNKE